MPQDNPWITIARTGTFQDSAGRDQTFSTADFDAIAANYNPAKQEAPLVFGHPKDSDPAFGWVEKLKSENGKLLARLASVPGAVRDLVANGSYRYVSMSLTPDKKNLRHVGLLGAVPPAITGLGPIALAGEPGITINFTSGDSATQSTKGDSTMPTPEELQQQIGALQQQLEAVRTENAQLKSKLADSDKNKSDKEEAEKKAEVTAAEFAAYKQAVEIKDRESRVDSLIVAGKLEPGKRDDTLTYAAALALAPTPVNFSTPDGKAEQITVLEKFLRDLEAKPVDPRFMNFSDFAPVPAHITESAPQYNPAELTAKL